MYELLIGSRVSFVKAVIGLKYQQLYKHIGPITDFLLMFCFGNTKAYWLHSQIKTQLDGCKPTIAYNTFIFETCLTIAAKKINVWGPVRLTFNKQITFYFFFFPSTSHEILVLLFYGLMTSWYLENSTKAGLGTLR